MLLLSRAQSQELEQRSINEYNLTSEELMEAAGSAALAVLRSASLSSGTLTKALFLIGPGNNGADGWVLLRQLLENEAMLCEVLCLDEGGSALWAAQQARVSKQNYTSISLTDLEPTLEQGKDWDVIVDAVFGTGLTRDLPAEWQSAFQVLKASRAVKLSLDLPSGLDADTGHMRGGAFKAHHTVTFGAAKPGLFLMDGPKHAGLVSVDALTYPKALIKEIARQRPRLRAFGGQAAAQILPPRDLSGHKGNFGQCLLICGSETYRGAGILTAEAALRSGPGYVHLANEEEIYPDLLKLPEVIYFQRDELFDREFDTKKTSVVLGPGLLDHDYLEKALRHLVEHEFEKVVLDAEALNALALMKDPPTLPESWILTPHPGELARLVGTTAAEINADRCRSATRAQRKWNAMILLKGFRTVLASAHRTTIVLSGNSSLAKAGSGDVLSGLIGGLLAQLPDAEQAGLLAAYLHGRIATLHVQAGGDPSTLIPSDLIRRLDPVVAQLRRSRTLQRPKS